MEIIYDGVVADKSRIKYAVKQNNNSNIIIFKIQKEQDSIVLDATKHFYIKIQNNYKTYIDKFPITASHISEKDEYILVSWYMSSKSTAFKNINVQLQYEDMSDDNRIVWQTEIINIDLFANIPADKIIEEEYPSILSYYQSVLDNHEERIIDLENKPAVIVKWGEIEGNIEDQEDLENKFNQKVDKVEGKSLSTNDYTNEDKNKLSGISSGANKVEITENTENGHILIDGEDKKVYDDANMRQAINNESQARQTADTNLDNKINAEISERQSADDELETKINTEIANRQSADTNLDSKINDEISERQSADDELGTKINTEISERTTLTDSLSSDMVIVKASIQDIQDLMPEQASSQNKLADKDFVNSSIATNTAYHRGTFSVEELGLTYEATHQQVAQALNTRITTVTNNDYVFVYFTNPATELIERYDKYKYNSQDEVFQYEYTLNNSSFTANQWAAINSGITAELVQKFIAYEATINGKADKTELVDYVKNTDYATSGKGGVIKADPYYALYISAEGKISCSTKTYTEYLNLGISTFMSKGTFENVLTGKQLTFDYIARKETVETDTTHTTSSRSFSSNVLYEYALALTSLNIASLEVQTGDLNPEWSVQFKVGSGFTFVSTPTIVWNGYVPNWSELVGEEVTIQIKPSVTSGVYIGTVTGKTGPKVIR